jgi:hypothetical protein
MYTITHSCGHTADILTQHGQLEASTVRFLADSTCDRCATVRQLSAAISAGQPVTSYAMQSAMQRVDTFPAHMHAGILADAMQLTA